MMQAMPMTSGSISTSSCGGSWIISARPAMPRAATVAYRLMPEVQALPSARLSACSVSIAINRSESDVPLFLDFVFDRLLERVHRGEIVHPAVRPARVDEHAVRHVALRRAFLRRHRRLAH